MNVEQTVNQTISGASDEDLDVIVDQGKKTLTGVLETYMEICRDLGIKIPDETGNLLIETTTLGLMKAVHEQGFRAGLNAAANLAGASRG